MRKLSRRRKSGKFQSSVRLSTGAESARSVTPDINTGAAPVAKLSGHSPESSLTKSLQLSERGASLPFPLSKGKEKKRGEHRKFPLSSLVSGNWTCTRAENRDRARYLFCRFLRGYRARILEFAMINQVTCQRSELRRTDGIVWFECQLHWRYLEIKNSIEKPVYPCN